MQLYAWLQYDRGTELLSQAYLYGRTKSSLYTLDRMWQMLEVLITVQAIIPVISIW